MRDFTEGEIDLLRELEQRLSSKAHILTEMSRQSQWTEQRMRLSAKAEGVNLALSFVQEYLREIPLDTNTSV